MVEHLERILEQVADDPGRRLSRLELMGARRARSALAEWNRTAAPYPADRCIHQLFEAQAARTPDAPAVVFGGESLTYRELDERANRLAHHLARPGRGPRGAGGDLPGARARAAGLHPGGDEGRRRLRAASTPPTRPSGSAYVLDDSGVAVLLTQARLRGRLPGAGRRPRRRRRRVVGRRSRGRARRRRRRGVDVREPGLRHLHLGEHGAAQGRGHAPPRRGQLHPLGDARLRGRRGERRAGVLVDGGGPDHHQPPPALRRAARCTSSPRRTPVEALAEVLRGKARASG